MAYIAPKDYATDPEVAEKIMRLMAGELDLSWMKHMPSSFLLGVLIRWARIGCQSSVPVLSMMATSP